MAKLTLNSIGSRYGSVDALNDNFDAIEQAIENTLSLDGTSPNALQADLDMNSNSILNANTIHASALVIGGQTLEPGDAVATATVQVFEFTATAGQTSFSVSPLTPASSSVLMEVNGLSLPTSSLVTSCSTLSFPALTLGDEVVVKVFTRDIGAYPAITNNEVATNAAIVSSKLSFTPSGTGAQVRSVQDKMRDTVSVLDFGADPTGVIDSTAAFTNAQIAANNIIIPPGTYLLDEFKQHNRKVFTGSGINNTFIKQANAGRPAWWCVAKSGVYQVQIIGAGLSGVWFLGASGATVASMIVEAVTPYVVAYSEFDIAGSGGYNTLEVKTGGAYEVYLCTFKVFQDNPDNRGGSSVGSTNTGVICGAGVYNQWYLKIAKAANGKAFTSGEWGTTFYQPTSEGSQIYIGQHNTIINPTIEAWSGSADPDGAFQIVGANNRVIGATLTNVPSAKCGDIGIALNGGGGVNTTILGYAIYGTYPLTAPIYPISIPSGNTGTFADFKTAGCQYKVDQYVSDAILKNFSFVGDVSEFTTKYGQASRYFGTFTPTLQFGGASTGITYTLRDAYFQRVGNVVTFTVSINLSSKGSATGTATISGLPIASRTSASTNQQFAIFTENVTISSGYLTAAVGSASTSIALVYAVSASGSSSLNDGQFANNSILRITGSYFTD